MIPLIQMEVTKKSHQNSMANSLKIRFSTQYPSPNTLEIPTGLQVDSWIKPPAPLEMNNYIFIGIIFGGEGFRVDVGQVWRSQGTVTDGHKMVSKHVTSPLIKKLSLLLFLISFSILHSDHIQQSQQPPHPKNIESNSLLDHPSPSSKSVSSIKTLAKLALERAKCSAVFFPLVTWDQKFLPNGEFFLSAKRWL